MIEKELCSLIIEKYYQDVFKFCMAQLKNKEDAEDCTQETFAEFFSKRKKLFLTDKISQWLFSTAFYVVKRFKKKNSIAKIIIDEEAENIEDNNANFNDLMNIIHTYLSESEAELLLEYNSCESKSEKNVLAKKKGISLKNLYTRITRIKQKLRSELDKADKI